MKRNRNWERAALVAVITAARISAAGPREAYVPLAASGWHARWDATTGGVGELWGGRVDAAGAVRDPDVAERAARAFVAAHAELFGTAADGLVLAANELDGDVRTVGFRQTSQGLPVVGGQVAFVFSHDRLFAVLAHAYPDVRTAAVAPRAGVTRAIYPLAPGDYRVVEVREVAAPHGPERWTEYVALDGTPLARTSNVMRATGTLAYDAGVRYATGPRASFPAGAAAITIDGAAATTGADGSFAWTGTSPATVVPGVTGTYVQVIDESGMPATASLPAQDGQTVTWSEAGNETGDAQVSAFVYASLAKAKAREVNPAVAAWLDTPLPVHVDTAGSCDAYSTADELHLFLAGAGCQNTALVGDVVFHEFGHTLHAHSIIAGAGAFQPELSEGLADFGAANLTEDPGVGRGFYFTDDPVRDLDPPGHEQHWPEDIDADTHVTGDILAGALWDLRKALVRDLGHDAGVVQTEKIFTGIMQRAASIPASYLAALVADDDDGNLGNGTPHECAIRQAFGVHGLADTGFETTTVAPPVIDGLALAVAVTVPSGQPCPPPQVTSITVTWRAGAGAASTFALAASGATWSGAFPAQPAGTLLHYRVDAALDDGTHIVLPDNPADPDYELYAGGAVPIACEPMDTDPGWAQTGNLGPEWEFARPYPTGAGRDPHATHTGLYMLGTAIQHGTYRPSEMTSIATPAYDVSGFSNVHLQYWRWLTVEDARYDQAAITVNGTQVWQNAATPGGTLDHIDKEWRFQDLDLGPLVTGGTAQITWSLATDDSNQFGGWMLDDVCLVGDPVAPTITAGGGGGCSTTPGPGAALVALVAYLLWRASSRSRSRRWPSRSVSARMP